MYVIFDTVLYFSAIRGSACRSTWRNMASEQTLRHSNWYGVLCTRVLWCAVHMWYGCCLVGGGGGELLLWNPEHHSAFVRVLVHL